ncbi:MAG TPA: NYN domain-containing protein [Verrucomicrobiae bacterium]|nr:NYN domain-containing protein [Verrucomicrobiae bacterium]
MDAFNWYFGIFQHRPAWKWLNIQSFFETLRLDEEVVAVKFFTALVDPRLHISSRRDRQKRYFKALGSLPKVRIILGKYQERTVTCQARDCQRRLQYVVAEEKKTDVNIAVHLLDDAIRNATESMVIVSGDSDLEPAVEWVRRNYPQVKITVYIPVLDDEDRQRRSDNYHRMGVICKPLPLADIPRHILPITIALGDNQNITRPLEWA